MSRFWWRLVRALAWCAVRVTFRSFRVAGREHVPQSGPALLVVNHPNSLLDAAALLLAVPRPVRFGAKEPLFRSRLWGPLLRRLGAVPVHRPQDVAAEAAGDESDGARRARNRDTYRAFVDALHAGEVCALFPEGFSHTEPSLQYVKAGAGRIALQAEEESDGALGVAVVPVGLTYRPRLAFRGEAHVRIGAPFGVSDLRGRPRSEAIPVAQQRIREALVPLMVHLDAPDLEPLVADLAALWEDHRRGGGDDVVPAPRAEVEAAIARCLNHYTATDPELIGNVRARHAAYVRAADEAGVGRAALALRQRPGQWTLELTGIGLQLVLGLPVYVAGMLTSYVPARLADALGRMWCRRDGSDVALPVARLVFGLFTFPAFWGLLTWLFFEWSQSAQATGAFCVALVLAAFGTNWYRRRAYAWRRRFVALAPAFVRRRALARAAVARERLLWLMQEGLLRYEAETGRPIVPTDASPLRLAEQRARSRRRVRAVAFTLLALAFAWLLAGVRPGTARALVERPSPWMRLAEERAAHRLEADAAALLGYVDALAAVDARSQELRLDFRTGRRDWYAPADDAAVHDCLAQFLTCREGLLRLAWYYRESPDTRTPRERAQAFLLAHTALVEACARGMQFVDTFAGDDRAVPKLNEADPARGIPAGLYDDIRATLSDRTALDRLAEGVAQFERLQRDGALPGDRPWPRIAERARRGTGVVASLSERFAKYELDTAVAAATTRADTARYVVSAAISTWIGDTKVRERPDRPGLITEEQVEHLRTQLRPGDILIERRNWYLSNAFLPGFWPHAALYHGGLDGLRELGIADDPRVAPRRAELARPDEGGHRYAVLEAMSEGVVFTSLEHSVGEADAVCVLRPRLPQERIAEAVARAFSHQGKPYDFDFDFFSTDKLVCTEVVYQAYASDIRIEPVEIMGRRTLPALEFVRMWADDRGRPDPRFELIAFLDHDEDAGVAREAGPDVLVETLDRPGLTLLGEKRGRPRILSTPVLGLALLALVTFLTPRR